MKILVCHPGKLGDVLWSLYVARVIAEHYRTSVSYLTSSYCEPLVTLLETQSWIRGVMVSEEYEEEHRELGIQPWKMPVFGEWDLVFQLGIHHGIRAGEHMLDYLWRVHEVGTKSIVPYPLHLGFRRTGNHRKVALVQAHTNNGNYPIGAWWKEFGKPVVESLRARQYEVVYYTDHVGYAWHCSIGDATPHRGYPLLEVALAMRNAVGFFGIASCQSVLAQLLRTPALVISQRQDGGKEWGLTGPCQTSLTQDEARAGDLVKIAEAVFP